jgi:hypothetical protein
VKQTILLILICACVSGCETPYQPLRAGGGYLDRQVAPDGFKVAFAGNGFTTRERVWAFVNVRSAELTLQHGFKFYKILGIEDRGEVRHGTYTTPSQTYGHFNSFTGTYTATTIPGQTFDVPIYLPGVKVLARCFGEQVADSKDAAGVIDRIKKPYGEIKLGQTTRITRNDLAGIGTY